ncbi:MAG TPA: M67 family metallopeptidase [Ktedonobacterales bacterium]|nr:M67 family metallopeptidase [Ktedonobacterales bacterium]
MVGLERLRLSPDVAGDGAGVLRVPAATLAAMLAHVLAGYPDEACGVLAGQDGAVTAHYATANAAATPRTFSEIAPRDLLRIWDEIDRRDWQMLAYYHSHPATPAYPSPRDVLWSQNWPGTFYIIFSLADPAAPVVRAFLISGERVAEYRLLAEP